MLNCKNVRDDRVIQFITFVFIQLFLYFCIHDLLYTRLLSVLFLKMSKNKKNIRKKLYYNGIIMSRLNFAFLLYLILILRRASFHYYKEKISHDKKFQFQYYIV